MHKRILIGCYEIPGQGGANTASYHLFQLLRKDGFDVSYLNIVDEQEADYYRYAFGENFGNPKGLRSVYNCILKAPPYFPHPELTALIQELSPDLLMGIDFIASLLMKRACPDKKLLFITAGCQQIKDSIIRGDVRDVITYQRMIEGAIGRPDTPCKEEREAVEISDFIITHSDMTMWLYRYFFPYHTGKIYNRVIWFAEWIYNEALDYSRLRKPFHQRDIDIIFISSSWGRPEKNYKLVKKIVSRLRSSRIHIVGEIEEKIPGVTYHSLVTEREKVFALMGRAKTVVCPSRYDSAPGILFEAAAMECNIIASKNCGNWMICNDQLLIDPFTTDQFVHKCALSLAHKFDDNMNFFLASESYCNLAETIQVV